jgi:hypothetical protein
LGGFDHALGAFDKDLAGGSVKRNTAEDAGTFGERMQCLDLGTLGGKAQRFGADAEMSGGSGQIEPKLDPVFSRTKH